MTQEKVFETLRVERGADSRILRVALSRPEVRNAFDDTLIRELSETFRDLETDDTTRVVVLEGAGKAFCAGADLAWMAKMVNFSVEENRRDSRALAEMFRLIDSCPKPVIARVHGAALGGGTGLVAVCDVAVAGEGTVFGTTEVRLGLIPSVISPYVVRKIGESYARAWFVTGDRITAREAQRAGLVHHVVLEDLLDDEVSRIAMSILHGGPQAQALAKQLVQWAGRESLETAIPKTIDWIAERRNSSEGQEGMTAFLEKRPPDWAGPR